METLFGNVDDKPSREPYLPGFLKAYDAYNHKVAKADAYKEWVRQNLEHDAEYIAERAFIYHMYCLKQNQWMVQFRRWLHGKRWNDVYPDELRKFSTIEEAYKGFVEDKWNWCGQLNCTGMKVTRNSLGLYLGGVKTLFPDEIRDQKFHWRPIRHDSPQKAIAPETPKAPPKPIEPAHVPMTAQEKAARLAEFRMMARQQNNPMLTGM